MKIALVQSEEETKFIKRKLSGEIKFVPFNLESQTYLILNGLSFINPKEFIPPDFQQKAIAYVDNELKKLPDQNFDYHGMNIEYKGHIRFVLNYTIFIIDFLETILKKNNIDEIIVSGWDSVNFSKYKSNNVFVISRVIKSLNLKKNVTILEKNFDNKKNNLYEYKLEKFNINSNKKKLLVNSVYYNFFRIILQCRVLGIKTFTVEYQRFELNFIKRLIYKILGLKIIKVSKIKSELKKVNITKKSINYKFYDITEIVNFRISELEYELTDILNKSNAFKKFLEENNFNYYFTNVVRGFDGAVTEILNSTGTKTVCISHGTIAESFDKFDSIYKKTISEAVFSGPSNYFAIQSNICKNSLKNTNQEIKKNSLETGNLIFSNAKGRLNNSILFATTLKPLHGTQLLGVEMYYEFLENLKDLHKLAINKNVKVVTNIHGSHKDCIYNLKKMFPKITFECKKIDKILNNSMITISHSSSVIEDSINSKVPVILLDKWKRYKHCEVNSGENFFPIFYVNDLTNLSNKIDFIRSNYSKLDFEKLLNGNNISFNIKNLFKKLEA